MIRIPEYLERAPAGRRGRPVDRRAGSGARVPGGAGPPVLTAVLATCDLVADRPHAPDSFKCSLTSVAAALALQTAGRVPARRPPSSSARLADGGEGKLEAVAAAGGWEWKEATVADPLGRRITARWLRSVDGTRAVVEMAESSGPVAGRRRGARCRPRKSAGLGDLLATVVASGCRRGHPRDRREEQQTDGGFGMLAVARDGGTRRVARAAAKSPRRSAIPDPTRRGSPCGSRPEPRPSPDVRRVRRLEPVARRDRAAAVYGPAKKKRRDR